MPNEEVEGSCYCRAVTFKVHLADASPGMHCYCKLCRKANGGSGASISVVGETKTFIVDGLENVTTYKAGLLDQASCRKTCTLTGVSESSSCAQAQWSDGKGGLQRSIYHRHFCRTCGCQLWAWAPSDPDTICPFASAIDTRLPVAEKRKHYMLYEAPEWLQVRVNAPPMHACMQILCSTVTTLSFAIHAAGAPRPR